MIKRIRKRFIIVAMLAVFLVLGSIVTAINCINYSNINQSADYILKMLVENGGEFGFNIPKPPFNEINEETPFETRYFYVRYSGTDVFVNTSHIKAVNATEARQIAEDVLTSNKEKGYYNYYRYVVDYDKDNNETLIIFMDCNKRIQTANSFLLASISISIVGTIAVFLLVLFFSKKAIYPMVEAYSKQKMFITNAGHELKTPLTIISANNELLEIENGENEYTKSIHNQVIRMSNMVKNLSRLSKLDEFSKVDKGNMSLSVLVKDVVEDFKPTISDKELLLQIEENVNIKADEALIRELLFILLDNARKYSVSKIQVYLEGGNHPVLLVKNDFDVLETQDVNKYFERFYRDSESRAKNIEGSGIGLAIAKEIVELHGGNIYIERENFDFIIKTVL